MANRVFLEFQSKANKTTIFVMWNFLPVHQLWKIYTNAVLNDPSFFPVYFFSIYSKVLKVAQNYKKKYDLPILKYKTCKLAHKSYDPCFHKK